MSFISSNAAPIMEKSFGKNEGVVKSDQPPCSVEYHYLSSLQNPPDYSEAKPDGRNTVLCRSIKIGEALGLVQWVGTKIHGSETLVTSRNNMPFPFITRSHGFLTGI
jgi:hypothetical protein